VPIPVAAAAPPVAPLPLGAFSPPPVPPAPRPVPPPLDNPGNVPVDLITTDLSDVTVRQVVRVSQGGTRLRLRFSAENSADGLPLAFGKRYNDTDHLHPNDAGNKAMGDAIDLSLIVK
jgi:hypothetical protein